MWYACAVILDRRQEGLGFEIPIDLGSGIRLEPLPDWVKGEEALSQLRPNDAEGVRQGELALAAEYEAEVLGSPDPDWKGASPRSIQSAIDEKFALASVTFWLVKPAPFTSGPVLHFGRKGDAISLRQAGSLRPVLISETEKEHILTAEDIGLGAELLKRIVSLDRSATVWSALRTLISALSERQWEVRYLLHWIVLEALFGPESPNETTYRLSQRISLFLGSNTDDRKRLFKEVKAAYAWRSKLVHGNRISGLTNERSIELIATTERIIRKAMTKILLAPAYLTKFDGKERNQFLDELMFQ